MSFILMRFPPPKRNRNITLPAFHEQNPEEHTAICPILFLPHSKATQPQRYRNLKYVSRLCQTRNPTHTAKQDVPEQNKDSKHPFRVMILPGTQVKR